MISLNYKDTLLHVGDRVKVKTNVVEGSKTRVQTFEGIILSIRGRGESKSFTVRRIGNRGIGVERTWPVESNTILGIEVSRKATKVRRAKLYFMRDLTGRAASRV